MKKGKAIGIILAIALCLAGCTSQKAEEETETPAPVTAETLPESSQDVTEGPEGEMTGETAKEAPSEPSEENPPESLPEESRAMTAAENSQVTDSESMTTGEYTYHVQTLEKSWLTEAGATACTVRLAYPVFEGSSATEAAVNDFYEEWVADRLEGYTDDPESIVNSALEIMSDPEYGDMPASEEDFTVENVTIRSKAISVYQSFYSYWGGAHGMPGRENHLFDRETGKEITLEDLTGRTTQELNDEMRGMFLELVETDTENKFFPDAADTLTQKEDYTSKYYLDEEGVVFYLEPYEVAPYAAGFTEILVPYDRSGIE